ncbi:MAG: hypothetical protein L6422_08995 [Candidatus Marinimicrobia bacterium]|nr:hypothetical protein [bacterium]MCG2716396.1 hypothetical protein [Candidatus Neomarinimicrobiota bacterium]
MLCHSTVMLKTWLPNPLRSLLKDKNYRIKDRKLVLQIPEYSYDVLLIE